MDDFRDAARLWGIEEGYHDVFGHWHTASQEVLTRLTAALSAGRDQPADFEVGPAGEGSVRAFQGDGRRLWVLVTQLYSVRSRRNWGHGDFTDLAHLIAIAASHGAAGIGLNPLHALFAGQASPYTPSSRLYLNVLYIDVEAIPEFPGIAAVGLEDEIAALRSKELIDYAGVWRVKLAALRAAFQNFRASDSTQRRADLEAYRQEQGDALLRYACFNALRDEQDPAPWPDWPDPWRNPDREQLLSYWQQHQDQCAFHEFTQWVADRQLNACKEAAHAAGMPVGLYIDLAVGIDPHGADGWSLQRAIVADVAVGAPPDELNTAGQDWGLAPFNPHTLAENDFGALRILMRAVMRHAGAIRLDHVLGLKRLFMIPRGLGASEGAYVRFPFESLLRVIAEESQRLRCVVIGEDLGTVPEGFRETIGRWGLWRYLVMLFERDGNGAFRPPEAYPAEALASFSTHDLSAFRGWLDGHDLRVKRGIGIDPGESDESRAWAHQQMRALLAERVPDFAPDDFAAVAFLLGTTPSRLVAIAMEDVLGVVEQVNVPGTIEQHPNWRRRLPVLLEDLSAHHGLHDLAAALRRAGRAFR